ncbi:MAG: hypothetical protein AAGA23_19755 [Pseudomonadota bacterium]
MKIFLLAAILGFAIFASARHAAAQEQEYGPPENATQCITLSRIARTEIIDDEHIAFHMKGRDGIFLNTLRRRCPGLRRDDTLMYRSSINRLCNVDIITVLDDFGFGFSPGVSCALGMFQATDEEYLEKLRSRPKLRGLKDDK